MFSSAEPNIEQVYEKGAELTNTKMVSLLV